MKAVLWIACGLLAATFITFIPAAAIVADTTDYEPAAVVIEESIRNKLGKSDATLAGEAVGHAIASAIELAFVPFLMIGLLILVARFMRRRKANARAN